MGLDESTLRAVSDGETLITLPNGIEIVRRRKHEPMVGMERLTKRALAAKTDKDWGSKFLPGTSLPDIIRMTTEALEECGAKLGDKDRSCGKVFDCPIGISDGELVRGLLVHRSRNGRYAHGFPVDETAI